MRHDESGEPLTDAIHAIFVELSKLKKILKKPVGEMTDLEKWAIFLRYSNIPKYREIVNEIIETKEALKMGAGLLMSVSKDERERAAFRSRKMYQTDLQSDMATAEDRGIRKGRVEGLREGRTEGLREGRTEQKIEIARSMIMDGEPIEKITRYTGLTFGDVEDLRGTN
jgi:predicted transposase/invertase (TIGR01784 family)